MKHSALSHTSTPHASSDVVWQVADLLATGYLRLRKRRAQRARSDSLENSLDDVGHSAKFGTGERRTSEKGETAHEW